MSGGRGPRMDPCDAHGNREKEREERNHSPTATNIIPQHAVHPSRARDGTFFPLVAGERSQAETLLPDPSSTASFLQNGPGTEKAHVVVVTGLRRPSEVRGKDETQVSLYVMGRRRKEGKERGKGPGRATGAEQGGNSETHALPFPSALAAPHVGRSSPSSSCVKCSSLGRSTDSLETPPLMRPTGRFHEGRRRRHHANRRRSIKKNDKRAAHLELIHSRNSRPDHRESFHRRALAD